MPALVVVVDSRTVSSVIDCDSVELLWNSVAQKSATGTGLGVVELDCFLSFDAHQAASQAN